MGNYADVKDAMSGRNKGNNYQTDPTQVTYVDNLYGKQLEEYQKNDPYGNASNGNSGTSRSFRQRGDVTQKRVNTDTRVRSEANSGTAGAGGKVAKGQQQGGMQQSLDAGVQTAQTEQIPQNAAWQASRQAVDLSSVRQRIMGNIKSNGRQ